MFYFLINPRRDVIQKDLVLKKYIFTFILFPDLEENIFDCSKIYLYFNKQKKNLRKKCIKDCRK